MSCALHGFAPSTSLWRRSSSRHGLHTSNGTAGRLAMKSNNTYHVEVRWCRSYDGRYEAEVASDVFGVPALP